MKKYTIDIDGLRKYLEKLNRFNFVDANDRRVTYPNGIIKRAKTIDEIEMYKLDKSKITLDCIINYGMPFLCDILGNDLSIIELSKKTNKMPNGRKLHCKFIETVIKDCHEVYGTALNGYWIIPEQFIKYDHGILA